MILSFIKEGALKIYKIYKNSWKFWFSFSPLYIQIEFTFHFHFVFVRTHSALHLFDDETILLKLFPIKIFEKVTIYCLRFYIAAAIRRIGRFHF